MEIRWGAMDPEGRRFQVIGPIPDNFIIIFTNPSTRAGYDTRSIFKRSLIGLNSEFSLLNTETKIFFGLLSRRLSDFILGNGYIDTSVQKGGVAGMPGCLEHTGVLTQLLRDAKENKGDLTVLWLDLANAYESTRHKLVVEALKRHHVPPSVCDLIADYYKNFRLRACSNSVEDTEDTVTSEWQTLEKGIITGCTMSAGKGGRGGMPRPFV